MKILYVDIDGPLATDECSSTVEKTKWHAKLYRMNSKCVDVLNEIISETGCEMIVSSDWRLKFNLEQLGEIFEWNNIIKKPIDVTCRELVSFSDSAKNRINQIKKSIDERKPESFAIIDDIPLGRQHYKIGLPNFVCCDVIEGLTGKGIKEQVIDYLNNKPQETNG